MSTIFTKIIKGEIPSYKIVEDDKFYAFLDISPLAKGHTLVVPKLETNYIFDLEDNYLGELHIFSKKVAIAIKKVVDCKRIGVAVIGLEVPHTHIHLVPINNVHDIDFSKPKLEISSKELEELSRKISAEII